MDKRALIIIVISWCIYKLVDYYFIPYFAVALLWVCLSFGFAVMVLFQLMKLIGEYKAVTQLRVIKVLVFSTLLFFTFKSWLVNRLIEKVDWVIFYDGRTDIVNQVKQKTLNPNVSWNNWVCELPYDFPVVSNGGNDIGINRSENGNTATVHFWIFRNFFDAPSTFFIYTNNPETIKYLEEKVTNDPENNWKLENNWYRSQESS